jgi:hypothetical protein
MPVPLDRCSVCSDEGITHLCERGWTKALCGRHNHHTIRGQNAACCIPMNSVAEDEERLQLYCEKCESYYREMATTHRYQTCPYFNGCKRCKTPGVKMTHVWGCRADELSSVVCSLCLIRYTTTTQEHRSNSCAYYRGCKKCGKKYKPPSHFGSCNESPQTVHSRTATEEDDIMYKCQTCQVFVPSEKYTKHKEDCEKLEIIIQASESRKTKREAFEWCWICDDGIDLPEMAAHQELCWKRLLIRYAKTGAYTNVIEKGLVDRRHDPLEETIKDGLQEVKFKEFP